MKVKSKERKPQQRITLKMAEKEAKYLSGLVDIVWWYEQPQELRVFLEGLYEALEAAGFAEGADDLGYVLKRAGR